MVLAAPLAIANIIQRIRPPCQWQGGFFSAFWAGYGNFERIFTKVRNPLILLGLWAFFICFFRVWIWELPRGRVVVPPPSSYHHNFTAKKFPKAPLWTRPSGTLAVWQEPVFPSGTLSPLTSVLRVAPSRVALRRLGLRPCPLTPLPLPSAEIRGRKSIIRGQMFQNVKGGC